MIREIYPERLYFGDAMDARDLRLLYHYRIAAVVDLAVNESPAQLARDMIYCRLPLDDGQPKRDHRTGHTLRRHANRNGYSNYDGLQRGDEPVASDRG